jgi:DNA-binding NtrC family response regulator
VGTMPPLLQSRLLRVLQEKEVRRVGDNTPVSVNVRVLAATNEPLEKRIKEGTFREDLYYRLNVIPIPVPALRERADDIPLLVAHFLKGKVHPRNGKPFQLTRPAIEALCAHDWPGNVRELENAIERACALAEENVIQVGDLPPQFQRYVPHTGATDTAIENRTVPTANADVMREIEAIDSTSPALGGARSISSINDPVGSLKNFMRDQEASYLHRALAQTSGDKEKAAELLGISLATLYRKLAEVEEAVV